MFSNHVWECYSAPQGGAASSSASGSSGGAASSPAGQVQMNDLQAILQSMGLPPQAGMKE
jgi:hypothetical protein